MYNYNTEISMDITKFKKLIPPKDRFWADPFIVSIDEKYYIFFEEALYSNPEKAHLAFLTINKQGEASKSRKILERPYHLSYPFIFKYKNELYMIPETASNRTVEVYKCLQFPENWKFEKTIISDVTGYDSTLIRFNNKWWLFITIIEFEGASSWDELYVYYADTPLSENWIPHPQNPVVSDVKNARPAGKIFMQDGCLFRPSQNSSWIYGYGININKITILNETEYQEEIVRSIIPDFDEKIMALHTINHENGFTIIDASYKRLRF